MRSCIPFPQGDAGSATSSRVVSRFSAAAVWVVVQPAHCRVTATASAISSRVFAEQVLLRARLAELAVAEHHTGAEPGDVTDLGEQLLAIAIRWRRCSAPSPAVEMFGLLGLVLGPLAIAYCLELIRLYEIEYGER